MCNLSLSHLSSLAVYFYWRRGGEHQRSCKSGEEEFRLSQVGPQKHTCRHSLTSQNTSHVLMHSVFVCVFRCFSFGIGEGASSALITGVAKEGGGHAQFITGADRMQPKVRHGTRQVINDYRRSSTSEKLNAFSNVATLQVMQSLRFAMQPAVLDISVTWDLPKGVSVTPLSPPITTLFQGQRSLLYAQLTGEVGAAPSGREMPI